MKESSGMTVSREVASVFSVWPLQRGDKITVTDRDGSKVETVVTDVGFDYVTLKQVDA